MNKGFFKEAAIGFLGEYTKDNCIKCILSMNGKKKSYPMIDSSKGSQAARIQLETALDGTVYATGAKSGVGAYTIVLYDGPIDINSNQEVTNESPLQNYFKLKTLKSKKAKITLYYVKNKSNGMSTKKLAELDGIITNMIVEASAEGDIKCYRVAITINGMWKNA